MKENLTSIIAIARYDVILIFSNSLWSDPVLASFKQIYNFFRKSWWDDNQNPWVMIKESKNWTRWRGVNLNYFLLSNNDTDLVFLFKGSLSLLIHFSSTLIKKFYFKIQGALHVPWVGFRVKASESEAL